MVLSKYCYIFLKPMTQICIQMKIPFYFHRKQKISGIKSRKEKGQMFLHSILEKFLLSPSLESKNAVIFGLALKS